MFYKNGHLPVNVSRHVGFASPLDFLCREDDDDDDDRCFDFLFRLDEDDEEQDEE